MTVSCIVYNDLTGEIAASYSVQDENVSRISVPPNHTLTVVTERPALDETHVDLGTVGTDGEVAVLPGRPAIEPPPVDIVPTHHSMSVEPVPYGVAINPLASDAT